MKARTNINAIVAGFGPYKGHSIKYKGRSREVNTSLQVAQRLAGTPRPYVLDLEAIKVYLKINSLEIPAVEKEASDTIFSAVRNSSPDMMIGLNMDPKIHHLVFETVANNCRHTFSDSDLSPPTEIVPGGTERYSLDESIYKPVMKKIEAETDHWCSETADYSARRNLSNEAFYAMMHLFKSEETRISSVLFMHIAAAQTIEEEALLIQAVRIALESTAESVAMKKQEKNDSGVLRIMI